jgi:hypothetical protein
MEWRPCVEWPSYEVSEYGDLRRLRASPRFPEGSIVKQSKKAAGYLYVHCCKDGKTVNFHVHRMVAHAFIGPSPSDKHEVAHADGRKMNNHYSNLRWATRYENCQDKNLHDSHPKLKKADIFDIRERFAKGNITKSAISREYDVSVTHVSRVLKRKIWA